MAFDKSRFRIRSASSLESLNHHHLFFDFNLLFQSHYLTYSFNKTYHTITIQTHSMDPEEDFTSVTWGNQNQPSQGEPSSSSVPSTSHSHSHSHARNPSTDAHRSTGGLETGLGAIGRSESARALSRAANDVEPPRWEGYLMVQVTDPRKEAENSKEMFISYGIRAEVSHVIAIRRERERERSELSHRGGRWAVG